MTSWYGAQLNKRHILMAWCLVKHRDNFNFKLYLHFHLHLYCNRNWLFNTSKVSCWTSPWESWTQFTSLQSISIVQTSSYNHKQLLHHLFKHYPAIYFSAPRFNFHPGGPFKFSVIFLSTSKQMLEKYHNICDTASFYILLNSPFIIISQCTIYNLHREESIAK
jgi:hypothetical protein